MKFEEWYDKYNCDIESLEDRQEACQLTWRTCKHEIIKELWEKVPMPSDRDSHYGKPLIVKIIELIEKKI